MRLPYCFLSLATGIAMAAGAFHLCATPPEEIPAPRPAGEQFAAPRFAGAQSCMATACHGKSTYTGADGDVLVRGAEYTFWRDMDPHARAGATLHSPRSRRMLAALKLVEQADISRRCGSCHSPMPAPEHRLDSFVARQGVSCEDCHGPSEHWRSTHFRQASSPMTETKKLAVRTEVCAGCHIGSPGRVVDHDLIAAGHPVLQFEMASFHDRLPKHWDEVRDRGRQPGGFETALWSHGQRALLERAVADVESMKSGRIELSSFDCYACHHEG